MFEAHEEVMSNLKSRITYHLTSQQKAQVVATKDIVCMLASGWSTNSQRGFTRC
jgi:hypothetical protein